MIETTKCPKCLKGDLVERNGKHGLFRACNAYPDCKFTQPIPQINEENKMAIAGLSKDRLIVRQSSVNRAIEWAALMPKPVPKVEAILAMAELVENWVFRKNESA